MSIDHQETTPNGDDRLSQLRQLLLSPEQQELEELKLRLEESSIDAQKLSELLPEAISRRTSQDDQLGQSLAPTLTTAFKDSIRRDPKSLVDAISPIMGPAIRRYITQTIASMVQSLNQSLEASFSWQGLKWRLESLRTGKPFAEVVLLHTLLFRIEQLFLIHRETGILLTHVVSPGGSGADADLVSGMLTAIQDFVKDSFGGDEEDTLETMRCGEHTIWIEHGPSAVLASVIRGQPPNGLHNQLCETLENIHVNWSEELANFNGDTGPFEAAEPVLERCLVTEYRPAASPKPVASGWRQWIVPVGLALGLVALIAWWRYEPPTAAATRILQPPETVEIQVIDDRLCLVGEARNLWISKIEDRMANANRTPTLDVTRLKNLDQPWLDFLNLLEEAPGIAVIQQQILKDRYTISGLRDPLAENPDSLMVRASVDPSLVDAHWRPYQSLEDPIVLRRAEKRLTPPDSVHLQIKDGTLTATGSADTRWIEGARQKQELLGVDRIDLQPLDIVDESWNRFVEHLRREPGIIVKDNRYSPDISRIVGSKDPLAVDPLSFANQFGISRDSIESQWSAHVSPDKDFRSARLRSLLQPPETVLLELESDRLTISGEAPHRWIISLKQHSELLNQLGVVDRTGLVCSEEQSIEAFATTCRQLAVWFQSRSSNVGESTRRGLGPLVRAWSSASDVAKGVGGRVRLIVLGVESENWEQSGQDTDLAKQRAQNAATALAELGVPRNEMSVRTEVQKAVARDGRGRQLGVRFLLEYSNSSEGSRL